MLLLIECYIKLTSSDMKLKLKQHKNVDVLVLAPIGTRESTLAVDFVCHSRTVLELDLLSHFWRQNEIFCVHSFVSHLLSFWRQKPYASVFLNCSSCRTKNVTSCELILLLHSRTFATEQYQRRVGTMVAAFDTGVVELRQGSSGNGSWTSIGSVSDRVPSD